MYRFFATFSIFLLLFASCEKKQEYGYVRLIFEHHWGEEGIIRIDGTTQYTNAAGNILTFTNLEYLISDLMIGYVKIGHPDVRYINHDTVNSVILLTHQIPTGNYHRIGFTFGLDVKKNQCGLYPNLFRMAWPESMGGGYHYMMLDGWWASEEGPRPANLHLGALEEIFQINTDTIWGEFDPETETQPIIRINIDTIYAKYHNFLQVSIPKTFTIEANTITTVGPIIMDVKQWMENPNRWDFNVMGYGCIMRRRHAMDSLVVNGTANVFRGATVGRGRDIVFR